MRYNDLITIDTLANAIARQEEGTTNPNQGAKADLVARVRRDLNLIAVEVGIRFAGGLVPADAARLEEAYGKHEVLEDRLEALSFGGSPVNVRTNLVVTERADPYSEVSDKIDNLKQAIISLGLVTHIEDKALLRLEAVRLTIGFS